MIDEGAKETRDGMALGAIAGRSSMDGRIGLSDGSRCNMVCAAVMAGGAVADDARMRKRRDRGYECRRDVTQIAVLCRRYVDCCLVQQRIVGVEPADMTPFATAHNARMNRYPET